MKKRILASFLSLVLVLSLVPMSALAVEEQTGPETPVCAGLEGCTEDAHDPACPLYVAPGGDNNAYYEFEDVTTLGTPSALTTQAADGMSGNCGATESDSVTWALTENEDGEDTYTLTISGSGAMADYTGATATPWHSKLSTLGKKTSGYNGRNFANITEIVVLEGVTRIGKNAFGFTTVSSVKIAATVESIGAGAFLWDPWLKELAIPASVTNMHRNGDGTYYNPLDGTFNLEKVSITGDDAVYQVVQNGILLGPVDEDSNDLMIINCPDNLGNGTTSVSAEFPDNTVLVGNTAFGGCRNLVSIQLPDTIKEIRSSAFLKCYALTSFDVPADVTELPNNVFQGCSSLETISLNNVETICEYAFGGQIQAGETDNTQHSCTALKVLDLSNSKVSTIEKYAFQYAGLEQVTLPAGVQIGYAVFDRNASLKTVAFSGDYELTNEGAQQIFTNCTAIESVTFADGSTIDISNNLFENNANLKNIDLSGVTLRTGEIGTKAFNGCAALESVLFPENSLETIGFQAFYNTALKQITLPSTVKTVGQESFASIDSLVAVDATKLVSTEFKSNAFTGMAQGSAIYTGTSTVAAAVGSNYTEETTFIAVTNGGTFAPDTEFTSNTLATPTKEGSIFAGWYDSETCTGTSVTTPEAKKTYYAKWIELNAEDISIQYGDTQAVPTISGVSLNSWTSADTSIVQIEDGQLKAVGVGTTTITASAALARSGETLTVTVTVTPMPITFGTGDGENPNSTITYQYTGMAPEFSDFATFYPAKVVNGQVSIVEDSKAVTLTDGTDIVFVYDAGAGEQQYDYLPINVTDNLEHGIEVTVKLVNKNYRFVTATNATLSDSIKENVIVTAEGKTEVSIIGLPAVGENPSYAYTGKAIAPIGNLTRISAGTIDKFTVHFHPWGDTDFAEAHLTDKPTSELTPEAIANIAPTEPGSYLMIVDGTNDTQYVYQSWIFTITKATVTIRPNDKKAYVGDAVPALGENDYTVTGLADGEPLTKAPTLAYASTPDMNATGTYAIKASGAEVNEAHYTLVYEDGTLTVSRRSSGGGGGSSSSSTTTETERNPDGSTTTTVTDKKTGTVTETTKFKDGSTLVVETKKDGTITTTETAKNGVKVRTVDEPGEDVTATVTIPRSVGEAVVTIPADVDYGMVAVDADTGEIVKLSVPTEDGMTVKLDGSAELVLVDRSLDFTDTNNHWAEDAIDFATAHELFAGTSDTTFSPDSSMTRAMLMTVLARFDGQDTTGGAVWYEKAMAWAKENGISDGSNPDGNITREQFATMLWRYAGSPAVSGMALNEFGDSASVNGYAVDAMRWAVSSGIIGGTDAGLLMPQGNATRAQVATMLMRFVEGLTK